MRIPAILFCLLAASFWLSHDCADAQVAAGDLLITLSETPEFRAESPLAPGFVRAARLHVYDGKAKAVLALSKPKLSSPNQITYAAPSLTVDLRLEPIGRCIVWRVMCRNRGQGQLWLELGPELRVGRTDGLTIFDGWDDLPSPTKSLVSARMEGNFPVTSLWNDKVALGVGLEPSALVSYFRHEYEPLKDGARLACLTRIVVDSGKEETTPFITCAAPGEWGKYEVLEAYYESFPAWFRARPDVDARASLGSSMYRAFPISEWSPEICRRLWAGWEWCYAPFRRTGDIAVRPELSEYKPARPPDKRRRLPCDEFRAWRRQVFTDGQNKCNIAMMFYIPAQIWCEESLARERYADALTTDPKAKTYFDTPWVTHHDNELRVFPLGTSFAEQSYKDMREVAEELDLSGFAFDTAGGAARYIGPALPRLPFRAWDDEVGVYCAESVAIALLMDFVHTLKKNGKTLAVVSNPMAYGTYASCFHSDSAMLEGMPWSHERTLGDRLRWKMGHKTLVWWEGYEIEDFVNPDNVTPNQLKAVYRGLADFTLLQSLRLGYVPPPAYTQGFKKLVAWLPALTECVQTGWQPVPAARAQAPLWTSRYGRGLDTLIAVAHETGTPVQSDVIVENRRLSKGVLLFSHYDGAQATNLVANGETSLRLVVPVRTPVLLCAQMEVSPAEAVSQARVSAEDGISRYTLKATLSGTGKATVRLRVPKDMRVDSVMWNGSRAEVFDSQIKVSLGTQDLLEARFASKLFDLADSDLLEFPFVKDGKPNCSILVSNEATETERLMAWRIQEYFRYWYGRVSKPATKVMIPIETSAVGRAVVVRIREGHHARVTLEGERLVIEAPSADELTSAVLKVLRALDRKYWSPDLLPPTVLHKKLGLADTVLE